MRSIAIRAGDTGHISAMARQLRSAIWWRLFCVIRPSALKRDMSRDSVSALRAKCCAISVRESGRVDGNGRARCNAQFQSHLNQESCEPLRAVERRQNRCMEAGASGLTIALAVVGGEQVWICGEQAEHRFRLVTQGLRRGGGDERAFGEVRHGTGCDHVAREIEGNEPGVAGRHGDTGRDDTGLHGEDQIILRGSEEDALALAQLQRGGLGIECREAGEEGAGRALCGWECWGARVGLLALAISEGHSVSDPS